MSKPERIVVATFAPHEILHALRATYPERIQTAEYQDRGWSVWGKLTDTGFALVVGP